MVTVLGIAEGTFDGARRDPFRSHHGVMSAHASDDGRFAPSPTGDLHLGNQRTAVVAWLFARSAGARFLVRMEDLDAGRVRPGVAERQLEDLAAIGLDWDGEVVAQSSRAHSYDAALQELERDGRLYECFCTRAEIREAVSAPHGPSAGGRYPGTCAQLTPDERAERERAGRRPALRVRSQGVTISFDDELLGPQRAQVDDFVVRRNDGAPAYNLAVVVDDAAQGVGKVVRGADLVDTTPRQLLLARYLGLAPPRYAHVPLVLGVDGARLAKRHGGVTLRDITPETALEWIAGSLGLPAQGTPRALLDAFDPQTLPREPVTFDSAMLRPR